jgi:hypothetical protein
MVKNLLLSVAALFFVTAASAQKIYIPVPFGTTGSATPAMLALSNGLKEKGWNPELKSMGTCGPVKEIYNSSDRPSVILWANTWQESGNTCQLNIKQGNFVDVVRTSWKYLCGPKDQLDFKLEKGKTYRVAISSYKIEYTETILTELAKKLSISFKLIPYRDSGLINKAFESNEVDFTYAFTGLKYANEKKATCFYNNSTETVEGIPSIFSEIKFVPPLDVYNLFIITNNKGLTEKQFSKLKSDIRNVVGTDKTMNDQLKANHTDRFKGSIDQQYKFVLGQ